MVVRYLLPCLAKGPFHCACHFIVNISFLHNSRFRFHFIVLLFSSAVSFLASFLSFGHFFPLLNWVLFPLRFRVGLFWLFTSQFEFWESFVLSPLRSSRPQTQPATAFLYFFLRLGPQASYQEKSEITYTAGKDVLKDDDLRTWSIHPIFTDLCSAKLCETWWAESDLIWSSMLAVSWNQKHTTLLIPGFSFFK